MSRKNVLIAVAVVLVGAAVVAANLYFKRDKGVSRSRPTSSRRATSKPSCRRPGKIQPKRLVNISAETAGPRRRPRGQRRRPHHEGPVPAADRPEVAAHAASKGNAASLRIGGRIARRRCGRSVETARVAGANRAQQNLTRQRNLWAQQLTTREALEKAENDLRTAQSALQEREKQVTSQEQPHLAGAGDARQRALRPDQGAHGIADRRHRDAPQHPARAKPR